MQIASASTLLNSVGSRCSPNVRSKRASAHFGQHEQILSPHMTMLWSASWCSTLLATNHSRHPRREERFQVN